jgi:hypothetical protein
MVAQDAGAVRLGQGGPRVRPWRPRAAAALARWLGRETAAAADPPPAPPPVPYATNWDEVGEMFAGFAAGPRRPRR